MGAGPGRVLLVLAAASLLGPPQERAEAGLYPNLRFLTRSLPAGTVGVDYRAGMMVVEAVAPLTWSAAGLPPGLAFDDRTGTVLGRPTAPGAWTVDVTASDGYRTAVAPGLLLEVDLPAGPVPAALALEPLPDGRVGVPYSFVLRADGGVGPFVFGGTGLPPGLSLHGRTGTLSGTPAAAGTFFATVTVLDVGADTSTAREMPLVVDPPGSSFRFLTRRLNSWGGWFTFDRILTTGETGPVTFDADLPPGFSFDPGTGQLGGSPDMMGTFGAEDVPVTASDGTDTITTTLPFDVLPEAGMYFDFRSLPAAFAGLDYGRDAPVGVAARNAPGGLRYSAVGLPGGIACDPATGALTGRASCAGVYPVDLVAWLETGAPLDRIWSRVDLTVLPPGGGDPTSIAANYWVTRQELRPGEPWTGTWSGAGIWNADRRAQVLFDPAEDGFRVRTGTGWISLPPGSFGGNPGAWIHRTPREEMDPRYGPDEEVRIDTARQRVSWRAGRQNASVSLPSTLPHTLWLPSGPYFSLKLEFDEGGNYRPALGCRSPAFVVARGSLHAPGSGRGSLHARGFLADPAMAFEPGTSPLRVRLLDGAKEVLSREFTDLGRGSEAIDRATGRRFLRIRAAPDGAPVDGIAGFSYAGDTGRFALDLRAIDLAAVPRGEAHLGVELTVGSRVYHTAVTLFEGPGRRYSTRMR